MNELFWYGLLTGLLIGASNGHILRLVTLSKTDKKLRWVVAIAGVIIYAVAASLVAVGYWLGMVIAIVGPIIGITSIIIGRGSNVDLFQVVLGVPQLAGMILSAYLLWLLI